MTERREPTPNEQTHKKRAQRKRQRERRVKQIAERTGQRDRARRDRQNLADWIEANMPGVQVVREHSGRWFVIE